MQRKIFQDEFGLDPRLRALKHELITRLLKIVIHSFASLALVHTCCTRSISGVSETWAGASLAVSSEARCFAVRGRNGYFRHGSAVLIFLALFAAISDITAACLHLMELNWSFGLELYMILRTENHVGYLIVCWVSFRMEQTSTVQALLTINLDHFNQCSIMFWRIHFQLGQMLPFFIA